MGKHKNRGRKKTRSPKKKQQTTQEDNDNTSSKPLLLKIRHADPQTRLAALTTLHHHAGDYQNDMVLWQAVREQVMGGDLVVAALAASCLEEFLLVAGNNHDLATAGWYLILLGRTQEAQSHLIVKDDKPQQQPWLALAQACLSTLTCLVQTNGWVLERLERTPILRCDSFRVVFDSIRQLQEPAARLGYHLAEPRVIQPWYEEQRDNATTYLQNVQTLILSDASSLAPLTRLYWTGVLLECLSCLPLLLEKDEWSAQPLLQMVQSHLVLPTCPANERTALNHAWHAVQQDAHDQTLERTVVQQQHRKQEPARAIARRLKHANVTAKGLLPPRTGNNYATLVDTWRQRHGVLELALELTAHWTQTVVSLDDDDDDMPMEDEGPLDTDIRHVLTTPRLQTLLNPITDELSRTWPPDICQHYRDLQSQVGVCLTHTLLCNKDEDDIMEDDRATLWRDLVRAVPHQPSLAGTMVVLLQHCGVGAISSVADTEMVIQLLEEGNPSADPDAYRDLVSLVGRLLCQEQPNHSRELNVRVCTRLLTRTVCDPPTMVLAECLNVLMDLYSDDDRHTDVFEELGVLPQFQTAIPLLQQHIAKHDNNTEYLQEVLHNASRFIQYKTGCAS